MGLSENFARLIVRRLRQINWERLLNCYPTRSNVLSSTTRRILRLWSPWCSTQRVTMEWPLLCVLRCLGTFQVPLREHLSCNQGRWDLRLISCPETVENPPISNRHRYIFLERRLDQAPTHGSQVCCTNLTMDSHGQALQRCFAQRTHLTKLVHGILPPRSPKCHKAIISMKTEITFSYAQIQLTDAADRSSSTPSTKNETKYASAQS